MLFSFWNQLWIKNLITGAYILLVIVGSITFCYWTFQVDTGLSTELIKPSIRKVPIQTSCSSEIEKTRQAFEANQSPENWKAWSDMELGCKP